MQAIIISFPRLKFLTRCLYSAVGLALFLLSSCNESEQEAKPKTENAGSKEKTTITLPEYTIVKSEVDGNDATYRVQVGDTLPNEQESFAIFRKVTGIEEDAAATRNTAVYFTRDGFSALTDAQAYVMYTKSDKAPKYQLQSASNDRLKKMEALTFDSIPGKKLVVECLEAQGAKIIIYQKPSGEYFKVYIFGDGSYDFEPMKAGRGNSADAIVLYRIEDGEKFTYKEDDTGKSIEVYNGNNSLINCYKILKRG